MKDIQMEFMFSPYVWAKMQYMRDKTSNEVAGFAISRKGSLFSVEDFYLVKQKVGPATWKFDDKGLSDFYNNMIEAGWEPAEFGRILMHTHPGMGCTPSSIDENNFKENFGKCNWAIMFILSDGNKCSCAYQNNKDPKFRFELPVSINWGEEFKGTNFKEWDEEYNNLVSKETYITYGHFGHKNYQNSQGHIGSVIYSRNPYEYEDLDSDEINDWDWEWDDQVGDFVLKETPIKSELTDEIEAFDLETESNLVKIKKCLCYEGEDCYEGYECGDCGEIPASEGYRSVGSNQ